MEKALWPKQTQRKVSKPFISVSPKPTVLRFEPRLMIYLSAHSNFTAFHTSNLLLKDTLGIAENVLVNPTRPYTVGVFKPLFIFHSNLPDTNLKVIRKRKVFFLLLIKIAHSLCLCANSRKKEP